MGTRKHKSGSEDKLQPVDIDVEMKMVARGAPADTHGGLRQQLRADKKFAHELGALVEHGRKRFGEAYPGETRKRVFSNHAWAEAGYEDVAEIGELMGLKGL